MQYAAPEDTFRTHLGVDGGRSSNMIAALNRSMWDAWRPDIGFPYQAGSGYGDLNDQIIPAPPGQYHTNKSLGYGSNTMVVANKIQGKPAWLVNLTYWWRGTN